MIICHSDGSLGDLKNFNIASGSILNKNCSLFLPITKEFLFSLLQSPTGYLIDILNRSSGGLANAFNVVTLFMLCKQLKRQFVLFGFFV